MSIFSKFRENPSISGLSLNSLRSEKDKSEHDTIISRAMLRYYDDDDVPQWLEAAKASSEPSMRIPKPSLSSVSQPSISRTSLDFLNKTKQPVRENPITALTSNSTPAVGRDRKGRLGQKLRGSNW